MTWTRIGDTFMDRPDVAAVGRSARLLLLECYVWCNRQETDGLLPVAMLRRISDSEDLAGDMDELLAEGLLQPAGAGKVQLDWSEQEASEQLRQRREQRAERQRAYRRRGEKHAAGDHTECTDTCREKRKSAERVSSASRYALQDGSHDALPGRPAETKTRNASRNASQTRSVPSARPDPSRPDPSRPLGRERGEGGTSAGASLSSSAGAPADAAAGDMSRFSVADFASEAGDTAELLLCWTSEAAGVRLWATAGDVAEQDVDAVAWAANEAFAAGHRRLLMQGRQGLPDLRVDDAGRYGLLTSADAAEALRADLVEAMAAELAAGAGWHAAAAG